MTLCVSLGADRKDLVPFDKYANAALSLGSPSSAARALPTGAPSERVDRLVKTIAAQKSMRSDVVDETVALVDGWLEKNRAGLIAPADAAGASRPRQRCGMDYGFQVKGA